MKTVEELQAELDELLNWKTDMLRTIQYLLPLETALAISVEMENRKEIRERIKKLPEIK